MRVLIYFASAIIAACAVYMWSVRPIAMPLILYGDDVEIFTHSGEPLSPSAMKLYLGKFSKAKYYAAFAIGTNGRSGWAGTHNSPEDARATALAYCNKGSEGCKIYAELMPKGYDPKIYGMTISQPGAKKFAKFGTPNEIIEYALSEWGSWAIHSSLDWTILPSISVKRRCDAFMKKMDIPMYVPHKPCQSYIGRIYKVNN